MKSRRVWLVVLAVLLRAGSASAQEIVPGDRVRLSAPEVRDSPARGKVIEVRPDHLVVLVESHYSPTVVSRASLRRLEVARGKRSAATTGFVTGAIMGALAGGGLGLAYGSLCDLRGTPEPGVYECNRWEFAVFGAVLGGGAVGLVGAGLGAVIKQDVWLSVPIGKGAQVGIVPGPGLGAGVRVTF